MVSSDRARARCGGLLLIEARAKPLGKRSRRGPRSESASRLRSSGFSPTSTVQPQRPLLGLLPPARVLSLLPRVEVLARARLHAPLRVHDDRRGRERPGRDRAKREIRDLRSISSAPFRETYRLQAPRRVQKTVFSGRMDSFQERRLLVREHGPGRLLGEHATGPRLQPAACLDGDGQVLLEFGPAGDGFFKRSPSSTSCFKPARSSFWDGRSAVA